MEFIEKVLKFPLWNITGIVFWLIVVIILFSKLVFGSNWAAIISYRFFLGRDLNLSTRKLVDEFNAGTIEKHTVVDFIIGIFYRLTRIGIIGLLLAVIPTLLLYQQNKLFQNQNELLLYQDSLIYNQNEKITQQTDLLSKQIDLSTAQNELISDQNKSVKIQTSSLVLQNEKIDTQNLNLQIQNNLLEADRRGSLVFLMNNLLDKVDDEIKAESYKLDSIGNFTIDDDHLVPDKFRYNLSNPLIGRITALSRAFQPYQMLVNGNLSEPQSPERGQMFIALIQSGLNQDTYKRIFYESDFSYSVIGSISVRHGCLELASLSNSFIRNSKFPYSNLYGAFIDYADVSLCSFVSCDLEGATFEGSDLSVSTFKRANLAECNFSKAKLDRTIFNYANLEDADFYEADINYASFIGTNFKDTDIGIEQLMKAESLLDCINLEENTRNNLLKKRPCLFSSMGCKKYDDLLNKRLITVDSLNKIIRG